MCKNRVNIVWHRGLHVTIVPAFWAYVKEVRAAMAAIYANFWDHLDSNRKHERWVRNPQQYCHALVIYLQSYMYRRGEQIREKLSAGQREDLREKANEFRAILNKHLQVLRAYSWHRRSQT